MALTKHHPTEDTILTIVTTPTNQDIILTTVMTRTSHHLTDMILISHPTMNMKNLMRNHTNQSMKTSHLNQSMKTSHTNLNTSKSHTMIMKNLITRIHMNKNMNQSRTNQNMSRSHTMNMKNLLTRNHTNINMSLSHTMIMKPLITIPMSPMIITQSLSMSITKNIPTHLPNTSMATNNLSTRNMAAVIITTKNHMVVTKPIRNRYTVTSHTNQYMKPLVTKNHMNARNTKKKNTRNQNMIPKVNTMANLWNISTKMTLGENKN